MEKLQVVYRKVNDLIPYARNARTHSEEQITRLASSIKEFGFTNPILLDGENGVIAGHGRLLASKKLGLKEVPCIELAGLTKTQKQAYILADNKLALDAGWDEEMLKVELEDLLGNDVDLNVAGFSDDEIDGIVNEGSLSTDEEVEVPEPEAAPVTKRGEVWTLGAHRLMCGDSTDKKDIARLVGQEEGRGAIDLYLTDPPYGVSYVGGTNEAFTIQNDNLEDEEFRRFLASAFSTADAVMKPGAVFYIWHASVKNFIFQLACQDVKWDVREYLVWAKNSMTLGRQDYQWRHELCLYGWKDGAAHRWYSDRSQTTVLEFDKPSRCDIHPTMKPIGLFEYLIKNSSKKGDSVLDSFGGSGTTLIACEHLKRKAFLMELDNRYVDAIIKRWQDETGQEAVREDGVTFNSLRGEA